MIRQINKDINKLSIKALPATIEDIKVGEDLLDTLNANKDKCIGMAANMIGINKRIIVVNNGPFNMLMFNPVITKKNKAYKTEEGCLSLTGLRTCTRHEIIEVEYFDKEFNKKKKEFTGIEAEIIEHECDHLEGIII